MDRRAETIDKVMTAINAGEHGAALTLIEEAMAGNPADLGLLFLKSEALRLTGRLAEAEELLLAIHRDSPESAEVLFRLGVTRLQHDNPAGAVEAWDLGGKLDPHHHGIFIHLGETLFRLGRFEQAAAALNRAAELQTPSFGVALSLGVCLARQSANDDPVLAEEEERLAATQDERLADTVLQKYIARGHYESILWLTRAMRMAAPENPYWPAMAAAISNALTRYQEAAELSRIALLLEPESSVAAIHLGTALRQLGRRPEAETVLERAVRLAPDSPDASMGLATLHLETGRFDAAAQVSQAFDRRVGPAVSIRGSVVIAVLDYSPGSPFNILTLLDDLKSYEGEVICVFNNPQMFEDLRNHPRIDKFSFNKFNVGVSRGWNIGINQAEGDTIHILNADLHISVEMLYRMEHWLHTLPDALCVGVTAHWMDLGSMGETRVFNVGEFDQPMETDAVSGQLMSLHAQRLHDAGITFDPRLAPYFGEETDLALKIKRSGYKVYAVPERDFEHPWGISRQDRPIFLFGRQVNRMRCIVNNKILLRNKIDAYLRDHAITPGEGE